MIADPTPVHLEFSHHAGEHPERTALCGDGGAWTYAELDSAATDAARGLVASGVRPSDTVGLFLDRGPDLVVGLLAVLKASAVYVGLDPAFPLARLALMIANANPSLVVTNGAVTKLTPDVPAVGLPDLRALGRECTEDLPTPPGPDDPIYVVYTSGSTGKPKGIVQVHRTLSNLVAWQNARSGIRFDGATLQFSSVAFDVHLQEIFSTLATGGRICLVDEESRRDPEQLLAFLIRHEVTTAFLSVSTFNRLLGTPDRLARLPESLGDLVMAGEQLYVTDSIRRLLEQRPGLRIHNHYGVSESHVVTSTTLTGAGPLPTRVPIGTAIANVVLRLADDEERDIRSGETGEIWISGPCLAAEYRGDPARTTERFVRRDGVRWYRTGDLGRVLDTGGLEFVGRIDDQVKIRGHLVEIGDVETAVRSVPGVGDAVVSAFTDSIGERALAAWYEAPDALPVDELRRALASTLPDFMIPSRFVQVERFPVGATGKVDKQALVAAAASRPELTTEYVAPRSEIERRVASVIGAVVGLTKVGRDDNFFDLGASSLHLVEAAERLSTELGTKFSTLDLFRSPTVRAVAARLTRAERPTRRTSRRPSGGRVAIIGAAGRFPQGGGVNELWEGLLVGHEFLTNHDLDDLDPPRWFGPDSPNAVTRLGLVPDAYRFDNELFGVPAQEARWIDPQHRVFLEVVWAGLEDASVAPEHLDGRIGLWAGSEAALYFVDVAGRIASMSDYLKALTSTDKDFLTSRVAYLLGFEGPAVTVQSACSTSLVAVHLARRSLLDGECDVAVAGGVSIGHPQRVPHRHEAGLIYAADGRTRPYDVNGTGTNMTNGAAVVVLKRYADAVADGDDMLAVIAGSAVNNDGARKVGYSAPSVDGQIEVMLDALADADLAPGDIDYVEGHGTATPLGDAVEVAAIADVYGTPRPNPLLLGSIKGNVGHLNRAAGAAGLIKAAHVVSERQVPPTLHHHEPLPELDAAGIRVPTSVEHLPVENPSRAAVSSLGIGGTNAHVIVESPPASPAGRRPSTSSEIVALSAASAEALQGRLVDTASWIRAHPTAHIADLAHTLGAGRQVLLHRWATSARSLGECADELERASSREVAAKPVDERVAAFLFPGGGESVVGGLQGIVDRFDAAASIVDRATQALKMLSGPDVHSYLVDGEEPHDDLYGDSALRHPAIVTYSVALAELLRSIGVEPGGVAGYSLGQFAAAAVAGVMDVEEAVCLAYRRGQLIDELAPAGAMTSVLVSEDRIQALLPPHVSVAIRNAPGSLVASGPLDEILLLEERLAGEGIRHRRVNVQNPHHTGLMEPMRVRLREALAGVSLRAPTLPIVDNVTGALAAVDLSEVEAWTRHIVEPVEFGRCLAALADTGCDLFVDLGPAGALAGIAALALDDADSVSVASALTGSAGQAPMDGLAAGLASLWALGASVQLPELVAGTPVRLPPYRFGGEVFTIEDTDNVSAGFAHSAPPQVADDEGAWTWRETWERSRRPVEVETGDPLPARVVVLGDGPEADAFRQRCSGLGVEVVAEVWRSEDPAAPTVVADFRSCGPHDEPVRSATGLVKAAATNQARVLDTLRALDDAPAIYLIVTRGAVATSPTETVVPSRAGLVSLRRVIQQERSPGILCTLVDLDQVAADSAGETAALLLGEVVHGDAEGVVALRSDRRLVPSLVRASLGETTTLPAKGVVIVTGGQGAVGRVVCEHLARRGFDLVTVGRSAPGNGVESEARMSSAAASSRWRHVQGDIVDPGTARRAVAAADEMGELRGVLHLAAHVDAAHQRHLRLTDTTTSHDFVTFAEAKVRGCQELSELTSDRPLAFRVLFSSVSTTLGGLGYGPYAGANRVANAVAHNATVSGTPWHVIGWDVWETGNGRLATGTVRPMAVEKALGLLDRIVASDPVELLVSTTDLVARDSATARLAAPNVSEMATPDEDVDQLLAQMWADALGVGDLSDDRSFVELGGDSLTAIQLVIRVNRRLAVELSPGDMMGAGTLRAFADLVRSARPAASAEQSRTSGRIDALVASPLQERWFQMAHRGFGALEICVALRGPIDHHRLEEALDAVVRRHPILRRVYQQVDGQLSPSYAETPRCEFHDLRSIPYGEQPSSIGTLLTELRGPVLDLRRDAPFQPNLVILDEELAMLVVKTHHIAMDGWSASILVDDLVAAYEGAELEVAPDYTAFAATQRAYLASPAIDEDRAYWQRHFEGSPPPSRIAADEDRADRADDLHAEKVSFSIGSTEARLRATATELAMTPFTLLMATFALVVGRLVESDDVVVGTTAAGRRRADEDRMVGVFVNPLPLRILADPDEAVADYLKRVHTQLLEFHRHQRYLLADLVDHVEPFVGADLNDTFHAYLLMQNFPTVSMPSRLGPEVVEGDDDHPDPLLDAFTHKQASLMRDIELIVFERDHLSFNLWYRTGRYSRATVQEWQQLFVRVLAALVEPANRTKGLHQVGFGPATVMS